MRVAAACLAVSFACGVATARPIVIDFQELEFVGENWIYLPGDYSSQGYTLSNGHFAYFGTLDAWYPGSTAMWNDNTNTQAVLTADSGLPFGLVSIDLSPLLGAGIVPTTLHLQGYLNGALVGDQLLATSGIGRVLEHFTLGSEFMNVDKVVFVDDYPYTQFDNITLVPTPGVIGLAGMLGIVAARRRR
ncbi:MAG: hypothetical protein AMXMBFR58_32380 [Phycisphaerae bacterium]|nr:hypothetical protein [Phycisphaerales bacterium]MCK6477665.1 hypothetical protein [Phycisphaerales bacterium]